VVQIVRRSDFGSGGGIQWHRLETVYSADRLKNCLAPALLVVPNAEAFLAPQGRGLIWYS
jgi:hypothetical protein